MSTTKTVEGTFGLKQVTKEEFIKQWTSTAHQYWHLATTREDGEKIDTILAMVKAMAESKWDSME